MESHPSVKMRLVYSAAQADQAKIEREELSFEYIGTLAHEAVIRVGNGIDDTSCLRFTWYKWPRKMYESIRSTLSYK